MRIAKKDLLFRKGYKQTYTNEDFETQKVATLNPPTYNLIDTNQEEINPCFFRNLTKGVLRAFKNYEVEENGLKKWNKRVRRGEEQYFPEGCYPNPQDLLDHLALYSLLDFESYINEEQLVRINFERPGDGITFPDDGIPSLLGLESEKDYHSGMASIGYQNKEGNVVFATHPADMTAVTQLLFVYLDIIEYQAVGDTKAPRSHCSQSYIPKQLVSSGGVTFHKFGFHKTFVSQYSNSAC